MKNIHEKKLNGRRLNIHKSNGNKIHTTDDECFEKNLHCANAKDFD